MRISDWSSDVCSSDLHDQISVLLQFRRDPTGRRKRKCLRVGEVPVERVLAEFGWVEQDVALLDRGMHHRDRTTRQELRDIGFAGLVGPLLPARLGSDRTGGRTAGGGQ